MNRRLRPLVFAGLTFAGLAVAGILSASPAAAQQAPTAITIATEGAYAPWNFTQADGSLAGLEIDLAQNLCGRMKIQCKIVAQDWDGLIPALTVGKFDAIMAGMFITDKRLEVIAFSRPYAMDPAGFAVAKGSPLTGLGVDKVNLNDQAAAAPVIARMKTMLKGKVVGVQAATTMQAFLKKYLADTVEIREYKTTEQHDLDLAAGRLDALFAAKTALAATLAKPGFEGYEVAGPSLVGDVFGHGTAVGLRKQDTGLKAKFDEAIGAAIADGTIKALSQKWVKVDVTPQQ